MKTGDIHQKAGRFSLQGQSGMTLVEVVISLGITGLTVAGIITGYIFCTATTAKDSLYMAANAAAMARIEETRSAIWAPDRAEPLDQLVAANFPDKVVVLDKSGDGVVITSATVHTEISQISVTPPIRRIRVDCLWLFKGEEPIATSIETCRAPDQ